MKKRIFALLLTTICMQAQALYITVNSPNGGETLARGEALTVNWVDNVSENVKIELLKNGTAVQTIANSTESDGNYQWQMPYDLAAGNDYKVKITSTLLASLTDQSNDPFTVKLGSVDLTYPAGGEALAKGSACNIVWNDDLNENVKIELFKNNSLERVIASSTESDGSFLWQVPSTGIEAASGYQVRISSTVTNLVTDQSGSFSITGGYIEGNVSGFWPKSGSPYIIGADVTVPANQTLTIEPGSEVLFNAPAQFTVKGRLLAQGTKDEKIRFAPQDTSKYWYGLNFEKSNADTSKVEYSEITGVKADSWMKKLRNASIRSLTSCKDGGLIYSGMGIGFPYGVIKTDVNGNFLWGINIDGECNTIISTNDSCNVFLTYISTDKEYCQISKIDRSGNILWSNIFDIVGLAVVQNINNDYCIIGFNNIIQQTVVIKINHIGELLWRKTLEGVNVFAKDAKITIGNEIIAVGSGLSYWEGLSVAKFDFDANVIWKKVITNGDATASSVIISSDNCFVIAGRKNGRFWYAKYNNNGDEIFNKLTNYGTYDRYQSIIELQNHNYMFCCTGNLGISNFIVDNEGQLVKEEKVTTSFDRSDLIKVNEYPYSIFSDGATNSAVMNRYEINGSFIPFRASIGIYKSEITIANCLLNKNWGSFFCCDSHPNIINNLITHNTGGTLLNNSSPIIANNTFVNNSAENGTILYCDSASNPVFLNNICYNNTATNGSTIYLNDAASDPNFLYNNLPGGLSSISGAGSGANFSGQFIENMDINPQFTGSNDFSLSASSPCINAGYPGLDSSAFAQFGLPWSDLAGNPRLYNNRIDLGAYEFISDVRTVSGNITENVNWYEDTVKVTGNVTIASGVKVLINRGTVVQFQGRYGFTVNGKIKANGNASQPVIFEAKNPAVGWNGLYYPENSDQDSSFYYNCNFKHALADDGTSAVSFEDNGGLFRIKKGNKVVVSDCEIEDIEAKNNGGAIWIDESSVQIINCLFHHNKAGNQGGAIYAQNCNPLLLNNTMVYNQAANGGSALALQNSDALNYNNIIWFNTATTGKQIQLNDNNSDPDFKFCNIESGLNALSGTGSGDNFSGAWQDNISGNPDFTGTKSANSYALKSTSPCIDKGTPASSGFNFPLYDIDGNPRIYGSRIDIGAFEYTVVGLNGENTPSVLELKQNYPNPFNPSTTIVFTLPNSGYAELAIYNIKGQLVKTMVKGVCQAGTQQLTFDGSAFASGMYYYRLTTPNQSIAKKMILLK